MNFPLSSSKSMAQRSQDPKEEAHLLRQVGAGSPSAFRELYERYSRPLFSVCLKILGNREEAEEVTQDAFVRIWKYAHRYDPDLSRPFSWAILITRRLCWERLKSRTRRSEVMDELASEAEVLPQSEETVRRQVVLQDVSERSRVFLEKMPEGQRQSLELSIFGGLSHSEIANELNVPLGTVKAWIRRGLIELGENVREEPFDGRSNS